MENKSILATIGIIILGMIFFAGWLALLIIGSIALAGDGAVYGLEPVEGAVMVLVALLGGAGGASHK